MTASEPLAASGINRLINGIDYLSDLDTRHVARELIAATRSTHTGDQAATPQLGEQLFKIGKRNALPLRNIGEGNRPMLRM